MFEIVLTLDLRLLCIKIIFIYKKMKKIDVKIYDEPDEVFKEKEVLKMNVTIPKISLNYKFNLNDLPDHLSEKEKTVRVQNLCV